MPASALADPVTPLTSPQLQTPCDTSRFTALDEGPLFASVQRLLSRDGLSFLLAPGTTRNGVQGGVALSALLPDRRLPALDQGWP